MERAITTYSSGLLIVDTDISKEFSILYAQMDKVNVDVSMNISFDKDLFVEYIIYKNRFFSFKRSLKCSVTSKGGIFFIKNSDLGISVFNESYQGAIDALNFQFYSIYTNYALESDDKLSDQAKSLKEKILDLVSLAL